MNQQPSSPSRRRLAAAAATVVLIAVGFLVGRHLRTPVRPEVVAAFLDQTFGSGKVRFSDVKAQTRERGADTLQLTVTAKATTLFPLYSRLEPADYLRRTFQLDPDQVGEARSLLVSRSASQTPEFMAAGPFPEDPYQMALLQLTCPADAPFSFQGIVDARKSGSTWVLSLASGSLDGGGPHGEARSTFGDATLVTGEPGDDARLRALVSDFKAFAVRVAAIRQRTDSARASAIEVRRAMFLSRIAPGTIFRGTASEAGEPLPVPLYLQIVALSPEKDVTAVLRNEGGWRNARPFHGTWSADDAFENPTLNLTSSPDEAVREAGPFLENSQTWTLALRMDPSGALSEQDRVFRYDFQPVGAEAAAALKGRLQAEFDGAMAATKPGMLYIGSAVSRSTGASEAVMLRFTGQTEAGDSIDASLESTTRAWKRRLHGAVNANSRRSGGEPISLASPTAEAVADAPAESVLGDKDALEIRLGARANTLIGEDAAFTYRFSPPGEADLQRLEAERHERMHRFLGLLRTGIVLDGSMREEQGFVTHARLEVGRVDRATGTVMARIVSLNQPGIYRDFMGTFDPSGSSVALAAMGGGSLVTDGSFELPFLISPAAATVVLSLDPGNIITGLIEGDPRWAIAFPAATFAATPTEGIDPDSPAADGTVFPAFPEAQGAYLLKAGAWTPLPRNQGHVVVETIKTKTGDLAIPSNLLDVANMAAGAIDAQKGKRKIPYLEFNGKDPRVSSSGPALILLYVGPLPPGDPPLELAAADVMKDGQRRVEVAKGRPGEIRFGEQRMPAYVRPVSPRALLFTTTSTLPPGPYMLNVDGGYELVQE